MTVPASDIAARVDVRTQGWVAMIPKNQVTAEKVQHRTNLAARPDCYPCEEDLLVEHLHTRMTVRTSGLSRCGEQHVFNFTTHESRLAARTL